MPLRVLLPFLLLSLVPASVSAQDLGARITPDGIDQLTEVARSHLPEEHTLESLERVLSECPGGRKIVARVPETTIDLAWHELDLRTVDGALQVHVVLDLAVQTPLTLENPYACFGEAICDLSASAQNLEIDVALAAATGPHGGVEFHGADVSLALTADDLDLRSENCLLGDVAEWFINAVETWAVDLLIPRLEAMLSERISEMVTEVVDQRLELQVERSGFAIKARVEGLDLSRQEGLTLAGDADVDWTGLSLRMGEAPPTPAPEGEPLPSNFPGQLQLAVSDRLVNEALYEAWRGGLIAMLLRERSRTVSLGSDGVVQQLGLPNDSEIEISVDIEQPLAARFGRAGRDTAEVTLRGLHATIDVTPLNAPPSRFDVFVDGNAAAALRVDPDAGGLVLELRDLLIADLRVETGDYDLALDAARLQTFVRETVVPMISERLSGMPVAPSLHAVEGTFLHVTALESEGGWQRLGMDLHLPNPMDRTPPDTSLVEPRTLLAAGTAQFQVGGRDDTTPVSLLRFRAWLDDAPLFDGRATNLRTIRFDAVDGDHVLRVAAVDLNDNEDPVPAIHGFVVDGVPPRITMTQVPPAVVDEPTVRAAWEASDERSATIESRWLLRAVREDGTTEILQETPFRPDPGTLEIATGALDANDLYEVELVVRDEAGNLTSQKFGFAIHPSLATGCAVREPGVDRGPLAPLAALALVAWIRVRRRRR